MFDIFPVSVVARHCLGLMMAERYIDNVGLAAKFLDELDEETVTIP